jgi:inositol-hexakisphosphate kinase
MEDLTHTYQAPCMLDIKMGITSAGEDASDEKLLSMYKKDRSTTTVYLGQRITGYRSYQVNTDTYIKRGKDFTKHIRVNQYLNSLREYFHNGERLRTELVQYFLPMLEEAYQFMSTQNKFRFYSSSLLFVYDGKNQTPHGRIKMIDFAHVFDIQEPDGLDDGYLVGLVKLIEYFRILASE